ncbi:MAG: ATP-binding protein [Treponema sp.]|nr:ATP-binding protein [Treponema sp.]
MKINFKDLFFSLLTSGKYTSVQDEKNTDAIIRLIVLNITYTITSVIIIAMGAGDMRNGLVNQGLLELVIGFLIFMNLALLRTELPFMVGGLIIIAVFGGFCGLSIFAQSNLQGFNILWIFSYPLMSIFTLGLQLGLIPALLLFAVTIIGTFLPSMGGHEYTLPEALIICGVYLFILVLTVIYEYVRSIKDFWLSRQDSYMNMVFKNSGDIILLLDKDGCLVYCADVFLRKTGQHYENIRKIHYSVIFAGLGDPALLDEIAVFYQASQGEGRPAVFEKTFDIGKDGNPRHYEIHLTPMYNDSGVFEGAFVLFQDMTEIIETKEYLEQASRAKSNFLASMSHEIRTPLNAIIGMTTIASGTDQLERKDYCLEKISGASAHLLGIVNDILDMSKIEEGKFEISPAEFNFPAMLKRVANIFEFRMSEKKLGFSMKSDPAIPSRIVSDEQRLAQVITNLLGNAVKFTPDEGKISLEAKRLDSGGDLRFCELELRVTDSGIGISREQQEKLFQSFVQVDSSISRKYGGTGLGLAISRKIVEMMDGGIRVESQPGRGSAFIFTIKAEIPAADAKAASAGDGGADRAAALEGCPGKHILLAEDLEINREIVMSLLEDFRMDITEAENGQEAYDKFAASPEKFDLIFMDIHMPVVNGYEATKLIRSHSHPKAKTIPIIAMTANVFKEDIENCIAAGMNGHIGKPLDFNEVTAVLKKYLCVHP